MSELFVIIARDKPDSLALRTGNRPAHLTHARTLGDRLKVAGPLLSEDAEPKPCGSLIIFEAENIAEARAFAAADPYARAGLFATVTVVPWRAALGSWLADS